MDLMTGLGLLASRGLDKSGYDTADSGRGTATPTNSSGTSTPEPWASGSVMQDTANSSLSFVFPLSPEKTSESPEKTNDSGGASASSTVSVKTVPVPSFLACGIDFDDSGNSEVGSDLDLFNLLNSDSLYPLIIDPNQGHNSFQTGAASSTNTASGAGASSANTGAEFAFTDTQLDSILGDLNQSSVYSEGPGATAFEVPSYMPLSSLEDGGASTSSPNSLLSDNSGKPVKEVRFTQQKKKKRKRKKPSNSPVEISPQKKRTGALRRAERNRVGTLKPLVNVVEILKEPAGRHLLSLREGVFSLTQSALPEGLSFNDFVDVISKLDGKVVNGFKITAIMSSEPEKYVQFKKEVV